MATDKAEVLQWMNSLPDGVRIAVDDGGLTLVVIGSDDYIEIGGVPDEEN
jgi:hypothetical protein